MLTYTLCRDCVCWLDGPGRPHAGTCRLGPGRVFTDPDHGCFSGSPRLKCPPNEPLDYDGDTPTSKRVPAECLTTGCGYDQASHCLRAGTKPHDKACVLPLEKGDGA